MLSPPDSPSILAKSDARLAALASPLGIGPSPVTGAPTARVRRGTAIETLGAVIRLGALMLEASDMCSRIIESSCTRDLVWSS